MHVRPTAEQRIDQTGVLIEHLIVFDLHGRGAAQDNGSQRQDGPGSIQGNKEG